MEFLLAAALIIMAVAGTFLIRGLFTHTKLNLAIPKDEPNMVSLYDLIQRQVAASPNNPLDDKEFPPLMGDTNSGIRFAPGLRDALWGSGRTKSKAWRAIYKTIMAINQGRITDWRIVENNVKEICAATCVDTVLDHLPMADITPVVKQVFWELARRSSEYEAVKWGIVIGSIGLQQAEVHGPPQC